MKCPGCHFDNPDGAKFCNECGSKLERVCPACGKSNPPGAKFCNECGQKLGDSVGTPPVKELTVEEKLDKIQRYLPQGVAEKILAQRGQIEGERKLVTVMFCDMKGYTSLSEKLDPEEVYSIMDQVYEILIREVHDYEGTVNELTGDGIMALFGAPIALEDAPQRAIRSALAIHHKIARFSDKLKQEAPGTPALKMRVGIHTGPVVVGTLGNDLRVEFKAVGDTVNLASRMETLAEPGTTFVTEDTFKLTEGYFRFEGLGAQNVKGKEQPVSVFRVIAPSTRRTRFDVSTERGLTRFVGRERELEIMLDCLERAKMGRGQAISIVAEAGIGKSRLLYEFRKAIANEDVTFFEGRCLSYSRNVPFFPIIDLLKSVFGLEEDESDDAIREKMKKGLIALNADEASTLPYLLEVLSVKDTGINPLMMSPEGKRDRIAGALKQVVLKGAAQRPLILAIEDLYWVDNSSVDVFKDLLDDIGGSTVFLIFTYRPNFVHTWGAKSYHSQITLNHLSNRESLAMAASLLGTDNIESKLEELVLEKTEGVPLYIEEFLRTLKELKIIGQAEGPYRIVKDFKELSIPSTIQDVIMTRVDALPQTAKEVLQAGSVVEREFSYDMIQKVTQVPEKELRSSLSILKEAELVFERGIYPETSYIFKHALTRDVVYNSLLNKRRKQLHEDIGNIIEQNSKQRLSEYYEVLAEHFTRSNDYRKAADYSKAAVKKAEKVALIHDAILYAENRISCLEKLPLDHEVEKQLVSARTALGLHWMQLGLVLKAKEAVDPIIDITYERNYNKRLAQINVILGNYYSLVVEDYPKGLAFFEKAIKIGKEQNDFLTIVLASNFMGICLSDMGRFEESLSSFELALDISRMGNVLWGMASIQSHLAIGVYFYKGQCRLLETISNEILDVSLKTNDMLSKAHASFALGSSKLLYGNLDDAEKHLTKSYELYIKCKQAILAAQSLAMIGSVLIFKEKYELAKECYDKARLTFAENQTKPSAVHIGKVFLGLIELMSNGSGIVLDDLFKCHKKINNKCLKSRASFAMGILLAKLDDGRTSMAEEWIEKSIETNLKYGMNWNLAHDYIVYSEYYQKRGQSIKAKEYMVKAIETFKECGADGWVEKYQKELSNLS